MSYPSNHYILFLQNNYTKQTFVHDVYNQSSDKLFYKFEDFEFDSHAPYGEYNYALVWCTLEYRVELSNELLDSKIIVTTSQGEDISLSLKDVVPDTGIVLYPDPNKINQEQLSLDEKTDFYSL